MENYVHVKEAVIVKPSEPTPACVLSLSAIDSQLFLRFSIEYLLIYPPRPNQDGGAISARLKNALAKALVPYFPLAGRVRSKPDGTSLEVLCRADGALFIEAVSDYSVSQFEATPRYVTEWRNLLSFNVVDVIGGYPPVIFQLTWLRDGAAAVGVGINHCICDGIGSAEFLNSFAELAAAKHELTKFKPRPVWDRHLLDAKPPFNNSTFLPEFNRVPDTCNFMTRFSGEPLVPTSITFEKKELDRLNNLALSTSQTGETSYTSFEVLSAHIWRSWARALELPSNQILKLLFSINIRDRVKPSLPAGYYGNGFVLGCAQTSVKFLESKGLGYAATLVKRAKESVGDKYVKKVVDSVSQKKASPEAPDSVGALILSQWSRLGLERVDFGMGRPVHVGPICTDRYCLLLPVCHEPASVKVMVALPASAVDKYQTLLRYPNI